MMDALAAELTGLDAVLAERLAAHRFDPVGFLRRATRLTDPAAMDNRIRHEVEPPRERDLLTLPPAGSEEERGLRLRGLELLSEGRVALAVLAGGMATRMGGVVKALEEAIPGRTFLDLRLAERRTLGREVGRDVPLWLMASAATHDVIRDALRERDTDDAVATFRQHLSLRLTPDGRLFRDDAGQPSEYATGHGDIVDAARESGLLGRFVERGGRVVTIANLDNLGASLDPVVIGLHAERGRPATCEAVEKRPTDRGGIPVRVGDRTVVLEEFRLPSGFDAARVRVFSTNTFHVDARALLALHPEWTYFVVEKQVQGRVAVQFERLVNEITAHLDTVYLRVPREGAGSRFLPVKDRAELDRRRPEIEAVGRARGML